MHAFSETGKASAVPPLQKVHALIKRPTPHVPTDFILSGEFILF